MQTPLIIGHRGAAGMAPENTLRAFKIGCKYADIVECDIHLSKDKKLVVLHDETLRRTAHMQGSIPDYDLKELEKFNVGRGEKIPELDKVVDAATSESKGLIIEIKGMTEKEATNIEGALSEFLAKTRPEIPIYVSSFWHKIIKIFKTKNPGTKTFILIDDSDSAQKAPELVYNANADGAGIKSSYISKELVVELHSKDFFINAWVVDDPIEFERLKSLGVDWITTNYPNRFVRQKMV